MRRDHRPYFIKKIWFGIMGFHLRHFLSPSLNALGDHPFVVKPWHVEVFGAPVRIGSNVTLLAASDKKTRLTVWTDKKDVPGITIGDHCLISPGVRIGAAESITISDNCMLASGVYITDSDWHGIYDRSLPPKEAHPVILRPNVWVGDGAIITKGVTIGENSIIGAGSVVTSDIPPNVIAAGNPASIVKELDPGRPIITRRDRFHDTDRISMLMDSQEKELLKGNTFRSWLLHLIRPTRND